MLTQVAWRNIWRNRLRSLVVIVSIILGIWSGLFMLALNNAFIVQRAETIINNSISHIQVHDSTFLKDNNIQYAIPAANEINAAIESNGLVKSHTQRLILNGMVSSPTGGYGVKINGIHPEKEQQVTNIYQKVIKGAYFEKMKRNPALIGEKLAKKLNVKLRSKIVLTFQNRDNDIIAGAFRVVGIYKTVDPKFDERNIYVKANDLNSLLGSEKMIHEIAIIVKNPDSVSILRDSLKAQFPTLAVRSWDQVSPSLGYYDEMMVQMMYIFIGIIMLALAFGIINTMLMAVLERKRELGMLMSVGMNKFKIFSMIMLETVFLSLIGGPLGIVLSYTTIQYTYHNGIDLSIVAKGLESFGVGAIIHPVLADKFYIDIAIMVVVTAILSAIYPAIKALRLKPVEAVRVL